jgi:hypothetical protein
MKPSGIAFAALSFAACMPPLPPPPDLQVTSPERGNIQDTGEGSVRVTGRAMPGSDGSPIYKVTVNGEQANLSSDGSFEVTVPTPEGAMLLQAIQQTLTDGRIVFYDKNILSGGHSFDYKSPPGM